MIWIIHLVFFVLRWREQYQNMIDKISKILIENINQKKKIKRIQIQNLVHIREIK